MASIAGPKEIVVSAEMTDDEQVIIAVRDSGAGVSVEAMPRMFDAFFTTKPSGMGIGLSISRSIIEAHDGKIWATPNDGPGLTVRFRVPARPAAQAASDAL